MKHLVRALKHRNFQLFFVGQSISLIGTWMTQVAMSWLVYRFTHSAFLLGLVGFSGQIPIFLFSAFAGGLVGSPPFASSSGDYSDLGNAPIVYFSGSHLNRKNQYH